MELKLNHMAWIPGERLKISQAPTTTLTKRSIIWEPRAQEINWHLQENGLRIILLA